MGIGVHGLTVTQVLGAGHQKGYKEIYRGVAININLLQKVKLEIVTEDQKADIIIKTIQETAKTGEIGDGKIFVFNVENVIRIRTGETGETAI